MSDFDADMAAWRQWLTAHRHDPDVLAGWARVGRKLAGSGDDA